MSNKRIIKEVFREISIDKITNIKTESPVSIPSIIIENPIQHSSFVNGIIVIEPIIIEPYVHNQTVASSIWTISILSNTYPSITVVDSAGTRVYGNESYDSVLKIITITFSAPFSGKAFIN